MIEFPIRRPAATLLVAMAVVLAAASGILRLELRTDGRALVPESAPEVRTDRAARERFALRDPIAVVVRSAHPEGVWNPETLRRVQDLTIAIQGLDGVLEADVLSFETEPGFRHKPRSLLFRTLLDPLPETEAAAAALRDDVRRIELYDGILVSHDGDSAAILVGTPPEGDRLALVAEIRRLATETIRNDSAPGTPDTVDIVGAPVAEALLGRHILADLGVPRSVLGDEIGDDSPKIPIGLVPLAVAVMGLVFFITFRRPAAALLPLVEVGGSLVIVFGVMGWAGIPIYLTTAVLPIIVTAVGIADEIHIFRRFLDVSRESPREDRASRVRKTVTDMAPPVIRTSLTTAAAFLSFALSPIGPVRTFGLFAALGVMVCMVWSLTIIPACLVLIGDPHWRRNVRPAQSTERLAAWAASGASFAHRHRLAILASAGLITLAALDGARRLTVQDSWLSGFDPKSQLADAIRRFDDGYLGSHLLQIVVESDAPQLDGAIPAEALKRFEVELDEIPPSASSLEGAWIRLFLDDDILEGGGVKKGKEWTTWVESARLEDDKTVLTMPRRRGSAQLWLRPGKDVEVRYEIRSQPLATVSMLENLHGFETFLDDRPEVGGVLGPARLLETVGFMMKPDDPESRRLPANQGEAKARWNNYSRIRGEERLHRLVDPEYSAGLVTAYLPSSNYAETKALMEAVEDYAQEHLEPQGLQLRFAGDVAVSQAMIAAVVDSQVRSLLLSLVIVFTVAALLGRSWRWGFYCTVPPAFAVLLDFAIMGWLGIPLGVATSMFAAMTLGIGVDFAIHLLSRRRLLHRTNPGDDTMVDAWRSTGPAIFVDAAAVGLGFGLLMLSQVPANARLGGLLTVAIVACLAATLFFVPALAASVESARHQLVRGG